MVVLIKPVPETTRLWSVEIPDEGYQEYVSGSGGQAESKGRALAKSRNGLYIYYKKDSFIRKIRCYGEWTPIKVQGIVVSV